MNSAVSETSLPKVISHYVQEQFDRDGTGLLLSRLGQTLTLQHAALKVQLGKKKLAEFLEEKMAGIVRVEVSPHDSKVSIVLPAGVDLTGDLSRYFPKRRAIEPTVAPVIPRYNRAVWAAFSQPVTVDAKRFLTFDPVVSFVDAAEKPPIADAVLVDNEFLISTSQVTDPAQRAKKIAENIDAWSKRHGVMPSLLLASSKPVSHNLPVGEKHSLLDLLLTALNENELKRIELPLDIISKLHNSKK